MVVNKLRYSQQTHSVKWGTVIHFHHDGLPSATNLIHAACSFMDKTFYSTIFCCYVCVCSLVTRVGKFIPAVTQEAAPYLLH